MKIGDWYKNKLIFAAVISMLVISVTSSQQSPQRPNADIGLRTLISQKIDALGTNDLGQEAVTEINKAGHDYLRGLPSSGEERIRILISQLNQQWAEEEKDYMTTKLLIRELSEQSLKPEQCEGMARYMRRHNIGTIDEAIIGCMVKLDLGEIKTIYTPEWRPIMIDYLEPQNITRSIL